MRMRTWCAALALLVAAIPAAGQTGLSEADALARLSTDSPRARAVRAGVEIARADALAAARWPNPQPSFTRESVAGVTEYLTTVSQLLPITGRRKFDIAAASALVSASSSRADDELRRLRGDLRLAYAQLVSAQARERELTDAVKRLQELRDVLTKRESEGDAAGFDQLRAEREVLDFQSDLVVASTDRARAQATLASFFADITDPSQIVAVGLSRSAAAAPVPALQALLKQAETTRGELMAYRHEVEAAGFAARAADRRRVPEPEIVAGTKSSSFDNGDLGSIFAVRATVPLFDRHRAERALAAAHASQAEARAASFRAVLRGEIAALREAVTLRRAAAERYRAEAVNSAAEIERIALVSYDAGERGILELLDAYRVGASARIRQATLDLAVREAEVELAFATGWESPL
jgi:cobalt-zinc-cadmium efflux system outer membrane protein